MTVLLILSLFILLYPIILVVLCIILMKDTRIIDKKTRDYHRPGITLMMIVNNPMEKSIEKTLRSLDNMNYPTDRYELYVFTKNSYANSVSIIRNSIFNSHVHTSCFHVPNNWNTSMILNNGFKYINRHSVLSHDKCNWVLGVLYYGSIMDSDFLIDISNEFKEELNVGVVYPQTHVTGNFLMNIKQSIKDYNCRISTILTNRCWSDNSVFLRG